MSDFLLTANEFKASMILVQECLENMGGSRPSDLEKDEFTWVAANDLIDNGWSKKSAQGTLSSLVIKGMIQQEEEDSWFITTLGWKWLDTKWDKYHKISDVKKEQEAFQLFPF